MNMTKKNRGVLYLLPNALSDDARKRTLSQEVIDTIATLDGLIAESEKAGRRYLSDFPTKRSAREIPIALYNKNAKEDEIDFLLEPIHEGQSWGLISDAGLPCIADPGHQLVARARSMGVQIQGMSGPCSFLLALMLSGLPGQAFAFHGYPPKEAKERGNWLVQIEKRASKDKATQIFMEAPHRNIALLEALTKQLHPDTKLCVAWNLSMPSQTVICQSMGHWQKMPFPSIEKKPAVFLLYR
jgi:16S rRNA (cytidine1402-2'-O)-methyltransferase